MALSKPRILLRGLFLGTGQFAPIQLKAWKSTDSATIAAVYGRRASAAAATAQEFGIPSSGNDLRALIARAVPDFADICTALEAHAEHIQASADAGLAILCQKPLAPTMDESRACVAYCREARSPLMVHDNWRWQPWYREIKRLLDAGTLGQPLSVYHTLRTGDGIGPEPYRDQAYFRTMPRFLLLETAIHYLDTYRFLFGEPHALSCQTRRGNSAIRGEDQAIVVLDFPSGPIVVWDGNRTVPTTRRKPPFNGTMRIEGSEAVLDISPDGAMQITDSHGATRAHTYTIREGYRGGSVTATLKHFVKCLRSNQPFETSGEDYLKTMELVFRAYESAASGKTLILSA